MNQHYTYLLIDLLCVLIPFLFSFHPKILFYKSWRAFAISCVATALFFVVWDAIFTRVGVWSFNPSYLTGIYLYNLPIEEALFFVCIPYASVFTYFCMRRFYGFDTYRGVAKWVGIVMIVTLLIIAGFNYPRLYTSVTFVLLSLLLGILLVKRVPYLAAFFIAFLIILIPFFISNGLLTGSGLQQPVVMYNNDYNLGIRMRTIPVEDIFYGMLLLLMNVAGFEYLNLKNRSKQAV